MRTTREILTFDRPFSLSAVDEVQLAGTYAVDVDEELMEGLSFLAYRHVATIIYLPLPRGGAGSVRAVRIDPDELAAGSRPDMREFPMTEHIDRLWNNLRIKLHGIDRKLGTSKNPSAGAAGGSR